MKYTIFGFSQSLMVEQGLNISDAGILRFMVDFYHTGKMRKTTVDGREYIWINYRYVAENLPIIFNGPKDLSLRTKKKRVAESLDRLHIAGIIEKLITRDATGTFVFVRIIEEMYLQYIAGVTQKQVRGVHETGNPVTQKQVTKDKSIIDYSIKDSKELPKGNMSEEESSNVKTPICQHKKIVSLYNETIGKILPSCKSTNKPFEGNLRARWREDESRQNLGWWEQYFNLVSSSDFLMGKTGEWKADLLWLVLPNNMSKVINGNYKNKGNSKNGKNQNYTGHDDREPVIENCFPEWD